ncbi:MAG: MopE-related protein, partial [Myxococcota bacterium]|nr:MopE-related protein [Myxococcota bacterium]
MNHAINYVAFAAVALTLVSCNGEVQYNDRNLDIDLVACLGAKDSGPASTCRNRISDEASESSENGCLILAIGDVNAPQTTYISVQWKDGWFDLGETAPIEASPGDPLSAEFYVFSKAGPAPSCDASSMPLGTECTDMAPWCLIKLTQPKTAVGASSIVLDFGGDADACRVEGQLTDDAVAEQCDGADNDCDGKIDEGAPDSGEACETGRPGVCATGVAQCIEGSVTCVATTSESAELCDGLDNDCDGAVDNGFEIGAACTTGQGVCEQAGEFVCADDQRGAVCSAVEMMGSEEVCDDVDNDCDGRVDEGFALGEPCEVGDGECTVSGVFVCEMGKAACSRKPLPPQGNEVCNGRDDDCDGKTDEEMNFENVGEACTVGLGLCARVGTIVCTEDGAETTCSVQPGLAMAGELCGNRVDDDCDGRVDEDETGQLESACTVGLGVCQRTGVLLCDTSERTQFVCSAPAIAPTEEDTACNARDEDCDGLNDEGYAPLNTTCGQGVCAAEGVTRCEQGVVVDSCTEGVQTDDDANCDGDDGDCDGLTDEAYTALMESCGEGACRVTIEAICIDGQLAVCTPNEPEIGDDDSLCDGLDSDCDGKIDEGYIETPTECGFGCAVEGAMACQNGVIVNTCDASVDPAAEDDTTCDGVDDDCDGELDENYASPVIFCGVGQCRQPGVNRCEDGAEVPVCVELPPGDELCGDTLDNDCDGKVDEGFEALGTACSNGLASCRREGVFTCNAARDALVCGADAGPIIGVDSTCDGVDDDCDGETDEHYVTPQSACGIGECRAAGEILCTDGRLEDTCTPGQPVPEICDGKDNDCDRATDEVCDGQPCTENADCLSDVCDTLDSNQCEPADTCGNGRVEGQEGCDDGNVVAGDGCDPTCFREDGQACTTTVQCANVCDTLDSQRCEPALTCGNGVEEAGEACDDGNTANDDGCAS